MADLQVLRAGDTCEISLFYVYVISLQDDKQDGGCGIFAFTHRAEADKWWLGDTNESGEPPFDLYGFQRVNQQLYTYPNDKLLLSSPIQHPAFIGAAGAFIANTQAGITAINLPIIPTFKGVEHVSGIFYYIRTATVPHLYWSVLKRESGSHTQDIIVSDKQRSRFLISAKRGEKGDIMLPDADTVITYDSGVVMKCAEKIYIDRTTGEDYHKKIVRGIRPEWIQLSDLFMGRIKMEMRSIGIVPMEARLAGTSSDGSGGGDIWELA
ncbi:hypothetical protein DFH27DRAFT_637377 [Peziza echinospora]|nr:hypothetical protein DFH27DRAFT_637377 [Peziza echinospora]